MKLSYALCLVFIPVMQPVFSIGYNNHPHARLSASVVIDSTVKIEVAEWMKNKGSLNFLENRGQMIDMQGNPVNSLLFRVSGSGVDMYITTSGLSYVFTKKKILKTEKINSIGEAQDSITGQYCRADMELVGADIRKENIVKEDESKDYNNYYLGKICPDGILNVHSYQRITIKNIYPGIDWVLYTNTGRKSTNVVPSPVGEGQEGVEYDFVVHPGADPSLIKLQYKCPPVPGRTGAGKPEMQNDGSLKINIPLGEIYEGTPISYISALLNSTVADKIHTNYTLHNGQIGFALAKYNKNKTLIIDPALSWALNWSTYYGGSGMDAANSLYNDGTHVWITGSTESTNFPLVTFTGGYNQDSLTGATQNIFILCFNVATGAEVWATYYGGTTGGESDAGVAITGDVNNIWVAASTTGSSTFPTSNTIGSDYYQTYNAVTNTTGLSGTAPTNGQNPVTPCSVVLEFTKAGVRQYASYFGGTCSQGDYNKSIWDDGKHVWMAGTASSTCFPVLYSNGYYNNTYQGSTAPFIVEFNAINSNLLWSTYFGTGSPGSGQAYSICSDGTNVWLTGDAYSGGVVATNPGGKAFYQGTSPTGDACTYIAEFNIANLANGSQPVWCTYFGGNATTTQLYGGTWTRTGYGSSIYSDGTSVWLTGLTGSTDFPLKNPGGGAYYQSINGGGLDSYIAKFNIALIPLAWSTYYGGSGTDADAGIQRDTSGNIWVTGYTTSTNFPTMIFGCDFNQSSLKGTQNAFILQFDTAGVRNWATYFGGNGTDAGTSIYGDGTNGWMTGNTTSTNFPTQSLNSGYNQSSLGGTGNENAFIAMFVPTRSFTATVNGTPSVCPGVMDTLSVTAPVGTNYLWSTGSTATADTIIVTPENSTIYTVTITNASCILNDTIKVTVKPLPNALITPVVNPICLGYTDTLIASGGGTYLWNNNTTSDSLIITPNTNTTYSVLVTNVCPKETSITVTINTIKPVIMGPGSICSGDTATLTSTGGGTYLWSTGSTNSSITIHPTTNTTYTVIVSNLCRDTVTQNISIDKPNFYACCDTIIYTPGTSVPLQASGATSYSWAPDSDMSCPTCPDQIVNPSASTTYTITGTDSLGCPAYSTITVDVDNCLKITIPDVFTPNGDGINDKFGIVAPFVSGYSIAIYDRWGKEMYQSTNQNAYWSGKNQNDNIYVADGVYYYIIKYTCADKSYNKDGYLQVIR